MDRVFVYGTLRTGGCRAMQAHYPRGIRISEGCVSGTLFDLGDYPGIRLGGESLVAGETYDVDEDTLQALDDLEGWHPDAPESCEYERKAVTVQYPDGTTGTAWIYEVAESRLIGCPVIKGGDWVAHKPLPG